jgi:hypothetical protein
MYKYIFINLPIYIYIFTYIYECKGRQIQKTGIVRNDAVNKLKLHTIFIARP